VPVDGWPDLLDEARKMKKDYSMIAGCVPRFSVLRIWSNPYFSPLMIGYNLRDSTQFIDTAGRPWEWLFIPKDMPESEWSFYNTLNIRLNHIFEHLPSLKKQVTFRGDIIQVAGKDEMDLFRASTIVTFALQTKPWMREVDLWRSFINVDLAFLEGLHRSWLDRGDEYCASLSKVFSSCNS